MLRRLRFLIFAVTLLPVTATFGRCQAPAAASAVANDLTRPIYPAVSHAGSDIFTSFSAGTIRSHPFLTHLMRLDRLSPNSREIASRPILARLSAEQRQQATAFRALNTAEQRRILDACESAWRVAERTVPFEATRRVDRVLSAGLGENGLNRSQMQNLADELRALSIYGESVRAEYRQVRRVMAERAMRSAAAVAGRLTDRGERFDGEMQSALPATLASQRLGASLRLAPHGDTASDYWDHGSVPEIRYQQLLSATMNLFTRSLPEAGAGTEIDHTLPRTWAGKWSIRLGQASLLKALRLRDARTFSHSFRVAYLSGLIAWQMGLPMQFVQKAIWGGLIHDIGKVEASLQKLVHKAGKLSSDEDILLRRHTLIGSQMIASADNLDPKSRRIGQQAALNHHENWNGTGYLQGLAGERIPLLARIIRVADSFDAMMENRPYQEGMSIEQARVFMERHSSSFDPRIYWAFMHILMTWMKPVDVPRRGVMQISQPKPPQLLASGAHP